MYRRFFTRVKHRHLVYAVIPIIMVFFVEIVILYLQTLDIIYQSFNKNDAVLAVNIMFRQVSVTLAMYLSVTLLVGFIITMLVYVAKHDGFKKGYESGLRDSSSSKVS